MKSIRMIRHSLTEGNERHLYYGWTDLPLTETGIRLCEEKRGSFTQTKDTLLIHTGMLRAKQTLEVLMDAGPTMVFTGLKEMSMGEFEMKSYDELRDVPAYQAWISGHGDDTPIPGGESTAQVRERVRSAIDEIMRLDFKDIFIICHGGTIAHAMQHFFPKSANTFYDWIPNALSGYEVRFENTTTYYKAI